MKPEDERYALFQRLIPMAQSRFKDGAFRTAGEQYEGVTQRTLQPSLLAEELKKYGVGIDIETPEVRHAAQEHAAILDIGSVEINLHAIDQNEDDRKDIEDVARYLRAWYYKLFEEEGGNLIMNTGQVGPRGLAILRFLWQMPNEPEWAEQERDENLADYTSRSVKAREAHFSTNKHDEFRLQPVSWKNIAFGPNPADPKVFIEDVEIPLWEYRELKNAKGDYLALVDDKIAWLGVPEPIVGEQGLAPLHEKRVRCAYIAYQIPGSKDDWKLSTLVYPGGGNILADGELLEEVDVPSRMCPYIIVPSGDEEMDATDPHVRYQPGLMMRLYVWAIEFNQVMTTLLALAIKEAADKNIYIDTFDLTADKRALLQEIGLLDGISQQRRLTMEAPDPGLNEIIISPRLRRKPESIKEAFYYVVDYYRERMREAAPSRFLSGRAEAEVREGTGMAVLNQTEAAQLPYKRYKDKQKNAIRKVLQSIINTLLTWEEEAGANAKPYYLPITQTYTDKEPDAKIVNVTPEKLRRHYQTTIEMRTETEQEALTRYQMADHDLEMGLLKVEEWAQRRGIQDVERWKRGMNVQRLRVKAAMALQGVEEQTILTLQSALTGINAMQLAQPQAGEEPAQTSPTPIPQPYRPITGDSMGGGVRLET
mgnify:FL=1